MAAPHRPPCARTLRKNLKMVFKFTGGTAANYHAARPRLLVVIRHIVTTHLFHLTSRYDDSA